MGELEWRRKEGKSRIGYSEEGGKNEGKKQESTFDIVLVAFRGTSRCFNDGI